MVVSSQKTNNNRMLSLITIPSMASMNRCTRKKRSYCVYDNKLAKIIQEQGSIQQLGKRLGSAKNPNCAAITPEELGQINFEYIDFKEFYPDMRANTNLPNFDEIKKRLQSATGE